MSVISVSLPTDGTTAEVLDYNTPITTIVNAINGNLDGDNISSLSGAKLTAGSVPASAMETAANPESRSNEIEFDFVASGCVWSGDAYGSTRVASMTSGVVYINGQRVSVSAVASRTFTASKDTYIDVGADGVVDYTEANNNAASPALSADHIRIGIIVTGASNIANVGSVNQGQDDKSLPVASSVYYHVSDSLGNLICPRDPQRRVLSYRAQSAAVTGVTTSETPFTGISAVANVPSGRKIRVTFQTQIESTNGGDSWFIRIKEDGVAILAPILITPTNSTRTLISVIVPWTPATSGVHTYTATVDDSSRTGTFASNLPGFILVELA